MMIKQKMAAALLVCGFLASVLSVSCKSAPASKPSGAGTVAPPAAKTTPDQVRLLREQALAARDDALAVKADKAVKDEFARANGAFNQGEAAFNKRSWADANTMYTQALEEFFVVTKIAREKRELAELAYRDANTAILEARRKALQTEAELQAAGMDADFSVDDESAGNYSTQY